MGRRKENEMDQKYIREMRLPDGKRCDDCQEIAICKAVINCNGKETVCDWWPSRFVEKQSAIHGAKAQIEQGNQD